MSSRGRMPIEHALASATSHPAAAYRLLDRGRITKGMRADLVLVEGDVRTNPRALWHTRTVWRNGAIGWARP
ncbi:MAG: amidohydrolase family protein [Nibricoccus sp.]